MEYKEKYGKENNDENIMNFFKYLEDFENSIRTEFNHKYCLFIKMEFQKDQIIDNNDYLYPINSFITFYNPINVDSQTFKIGNILIDGINSKTNGFEFMINSINSIYFKDIYYKQTNLESKKQSIINELNDIKTIRETEDTKDTTLSLSFYIVESYEILELHKIYEKYKTNDNYKNMLKKKGFVIENNLVTKLKGEYKKNINDGKILNNKTSSYIPNNDFLENLLLNKIDPLNFYYKNKNINDLLNKFFEQESSQKYDRSYIGGFIINDNLAFFTSNKLLSNKKDWSLLIYDQKCNQYIIKDEYSLLLSQNNTSLINIPKSLKKNNEKIKLYLSACKKYSKGKKNGIILSKINLDTKRMNSDFYDSQNFEVYCFCPIIILSEDSNLKYIETEYFLAGGFALDRKKGLIKLYKIRSKENSDDYAIEFIQDLIPQKKGKFKGFKRPIIYIAQSKLNGQIIVNCLDEIAYLFCQPELALLIKIQKEKTIIKTK